MMLLRIHTILDYIKVNIRKYKKIYVKMKKPYRRQLSKIVDVWLLFVCFRACRNNLYRI